MRVCSDNNAAAQVNKVNTERTTTASPDWKQGTASDGEEDHVSNHHAGWYAHATSRRRTRAAVKTETLNNNKTTATSVTSNNTATSMPSGRRRTKQVAKRPFKDDKDSDNGILSVGVVTKKSPAKNEVISLEGKTIKNTISDDSSTKDAEILWSASSSTSTAQRQDEREMCLLSSW